MSKKVYAIDFNEDYTTDTIPVSASFLLVFLIGTLILLPVIAPVVLIKGAYTWFKMFYDSRFVRKGRE